MSDMFDGLKPTDSGTEGVRPSSVTETHRYNISTPELEGDIQVETSVDEDITPEGEVFQLHVHSIIVCGCCGALASYDQDTRHKVPAARCVNCGVFLCGEHIQHEDSDLACCHCFKRLCVSCALRSHGLVFCREHFDKYVGDAHVDYVKNRISDYRRKEQVQD